jgi:hypothetical protein
LAGETETDMRARRSSALRAIGRSLGEGVMWMGFGWYGTHLPHPHPWPEYVFPPAEQPYLPPLSQEEFARWTALVDDL